MIVSSTWAGKRYAVLGLARSGQATVRALLASGAEVVAWDASEGARAALTPLHAFVEGAGVAPSSSREDKSGKGSHPQPLQQGLEGGGLSFADPTTIDLTGFTAVIVSPGVPLNRHPIAAHAAKYGVPIIGDIELFAQARPELPPHKVVGITGTNGKSTTTALVHHILKTAGVPVTMGGNIGLPILGQEPLTPNERGVGVYVLELSSYQIDLTFTLDCDVAILTNITPDHLDRYAGFDAYAASKRRLFEMQSQDHPIAVSTSTETALKQVEGFDKAIWKMSPDAKEPLQATWPSLPGPHNLENAQLARISCWCLGLNHLQINNALATFPGLPHRMERIRVKDGIIYINDSKATNATSTAPALASFSGIHWVLGGQAKTDDLNACEPYFCHCRAAYVIGDAAPLFYSLLRENMPVFLCGTLDVAVQQATDNATAEEIVLLSPACASFDQFRNYEDRGDQFRALVAAL